MPHDMMIVWRGEQQQANTAPTHTTKNTPKLLVIPDTHPTSPQTLSLHTSYSARRETVGPTRELYVCPLPMIPAFIQSHFCSCWLPIWGFGPYIWPMCLGRAQSVASGAVSCSCGGSLERLGGGGCSDCSWKSKKDQKEETKKKQHTHTELKPQLVVRLLLL